MNPVCARVRSMSDERRIDRVPRRVRHRPRGSGHQRVGELMKMTHLFAIDALEALDRTGKHGLGELRWHLTDMMLDLVEDGECCCEWCITDAGWTDVAMKIDAVYHIAREGIDILETKVMATSRYGGPWRDL